MVAFLQGEEGDDVELIQAALDENQLALPPPVLAELLSNPLLSKSVRTLLADLPILQVEPGYWTRAGALRAAALKEKKKARLGDALIAQSCLDQLTPLVTRDKDFRQFARIAGLSLF